MASKFENPELGKSYVASYDSGNSLYPIIVIHYDPNLAGYKLPKAYDPHPNASKYPNHVFIQSEPYAGDQRVKHTYMILPGPWSTDTKINEKTGDTWTIKKRNNRTSSIVFGTVTGASSLTATEMEGVNDDTLSKEIVITIPKSDHYSFATAIVSEAMISYTFPATLDTAAASLYPAYAAFGYRERIPSFVPCTVYDWWVISDTKPDMSAYFNQIIPSYCYIGGINFTNVIMDSVTLISGASVTYPSSTPSFSEYYGNGAYTGAGWKGNAKFIEAEAVPEKYDNLWRCTAKSVVML